MENKRASIARSLRFFAFDSDGVIFPNTVWEGVCLNGDSFKPKIRSYYDGQGVGLLRSLGLRLCIITNEGDANAAAIRSVVKKWNELPWAKKPPNEGGWHPIELFEGCGGPRKKYSTIIDWLCRHSGALSECGAMGDDLVDVPMLQAVAFAAAPVTAEESVKAICHFISVRPGGEGAVRDLANYMVKAHGKSPFELPFD